jgi:hypothetical protein
VEVKKRVAAGKKKKKLIRKGIVAIERRRQPRLSLELPLDYARVNIRQSYGGIVANASEMGILIYLPEKMEIGTTLSIEVFFARGVTLDTIKAIGTIVWYDLAARRSWGEHRYGFRFESIDKKNLDKWKNLLKDLGNTRSPFKI